MQFKKVKLSIIITIGFCLTTLHAQEAIFTTGGEASGNGGSASFSVGQVAYQTYSGTSGSLVEGVQQPYEITVLNGTEEIFGVNLEILRLVQIQ